MLRASKTLANRSGNKITITKAIRFTGCLVFIAGSLMYAQDIAVGNALGQGSWPLYNLDQARGCATTTNAQYTMAIQSPCSPDVISDNQEAAPAPSDVAITDHNAAMAAAPLPIQVKAPAMVNVEVWTHGSMAVRLTRGRNGVFTGVLDLSHEPTGPVSVRFYAWNTPPGDNSFTVSLAGILDLFVKNKPATIPFPAAAKGMKLAWEDDFNTLNAGSCLRDTGAWPNCTYVSAKDGYTWFESEPTVGSNFGDAAFESSADPAYNPFKIEDGFLRIRTTYDPNYVDPYGYGRLWYSGLLATAFPDGTTNVPQLQNGYYEARILTPNSWSGCAWCDTSGGTWPAFWQANLESLQPGEQDSGTGIELDTTEQYGEDPYYTQSGEIAYGNATGGGWIYHAYPNNLPDLTADFHRYGLLVTSSTVTAYLDDQPLGSIAKATIPGLAKPYWYVMLDLAMGGGWSDRVPPGNYYDMWIDYVRYYAAK